MDLDWTSDRKKLLTSLNFVYSIIICFLVVQDHRMELLVLENGILLKPLLGALAVLFNS